MGTSKLVTGLILTASWVVIFQQPLSAQNPTQSHENRANYSSRISHAAPVNRLSTTNMLAPMPASSQVGRVTFSDQPTGMLKPSVNNSLSYSIGDPSPASPPAANSTSATMLSLTDERTAVQSVTLSDQVPTPAKKPQSNETSWVNISGPQSMGPSSSAEIQQATISNFTDSAEAAYKASNPGHNFVLTTAAQSPSEQASVSHAYQAVTASGASSRRPTRQSAAQQSATSIPVSNTLSDQIPPAPVDRLLTAQPAVGSSPKSGIRQNFTSSTANPEFVNQFPNKQGPLSPTSSATRLKMSDVSGAKFADPKKFLKERSFDFADSSQFLKNGSATAESDGRIGSQMPTKLASNKKQNPRQDDLNQGLSRPAAKPVRDSNDELRRLTVSDVHAPIGLNPFGEIEQIDDRGILRRKPEMMFGQAPSTTYAELTGQYFQAHHATWEAHHFYHKPLYFEEVNLERYGNQRRFQNVASSAHFFTSAMLMPYKLGQTPPTTCVTTLGHHRPGECVPYQIHKGEPSTTGMIFQALPIIAISL